MRFIHIIGSATMFTKDVYEMISNNFKEDNHIFVSKFVNHYNYTQIQGAERIKSKSLKMLIYLYKSDFIIVHGLINKLVVILLFFQPWLLKKVNWIVWGGDIYPNGDKKISIFNKIIIKMRNKIIPKIKYISTLTTGDYNYLIKNYDLNNYHFEISYPVIASNKKLLDKNLRDRKKQNHVNILIGNSATKTNQHFEALDLLEKFKNEDIKIYIPLSYGQKDFELYADEVIKYGKEIFGDKIIPIKELMTGEEYLKFLNSIDIGIFNNNRQQAMGNISQLLMLGKKVYIRTDTNMWKHFTGLGCNIFDIESLKSYSNFEELVFMKDSDIEDNIRRLTIRNSIETKISQWKTMVAEMKKDR
ncbi:MAG: TDP-N-acetylfucosamine:lipid II N-acetylfucosaminyltransferase [Lagierella massiliensis]|nr:TDP-N-acetylfucosamine:lipid II N-acetylfucosaminyltransferase [Lagierella massiliensis]